MIILMRSRKAAPPVRQRLEPLDLEIVVAARSWFGRRLLLGDDRRRGLPAVRGARPGRGRRAAGLGGSGLPAVVLLALEIVPAAVARPADAGDAQREVVRVRAVPQRFLVADEVLLEEAHQRLVERLHPVGGEALRDRLKDIIGAVLVI